MVVWFSKIIAMAKITSLLQKSTFKINFSENKQSETERNLPDENKRWLIKQPDREICVFIFVDDVFVEQWLVWKKKKKAREIEIKKKKKWKQKWINVWAARWQNLSGETKSKIDIAKETVT